MPKPKPKSERPYADRDHPGNAADYLTGKLCIEGCGRQAGTAWSPHWCFECNVERMHRITALLEGLLYAR